MADKGTVGAKSRSERRRVAARQAIELRLAKAMAHPVRVKILEMMNERPVAPVEVSEAIGTALSNVSYHFRTLLELECIEAVEKEQVRGSIKTTYRSRTSLMFDDLCFATLPSSSKTSLSVAILKALYRRASDAIEVDTFDSRPDSHLSVTTLRLRWEAWEEVAELLEGALGRVLEIKDEEEAREDTVERFPATIGLLAFESPKLYE
jgi:DNA-binding transcriptional ArsR family regulator